MRAKRLTVCVYVCKGGFLLFMLALREDLSIHKPPGTFNTAKVLQDSLPQNPFPFKEESVMAHACQYNNVCGEEREQGESQARHWIMEGEEGVKG